MKAKQFTVAFVRSVAEPGRYHDGNGLFLNVKPSGSKQWVQRIVIHGKRRDLGLGGFPLVTLADARKAAFQNRQLARAGGDPAALRKRRAVPSFAAAAETVIAMHSETWRDGGKTAGQWRASLRDYAMPKLGAKPVDRITSMDVMTVLLPIWNTKRETARRVRQRIGAVCKWAIAEGHRIDNPAGDAIAAALPRNGNHRQHFKALPYSAVGDAVNRIRASAAYPTTKLAFEFLVLTAARSGEVRSAQWDEIDLDAATWTVPGERMKADRPHVVPLSGRALDVLREAREHSDGGGLIFPSLRGKVMSDMTISKLVKGRGIEAVPHGFRSSFRQWAAECTNVPREVCEEALAHVNPNKVEAAYQRSDLLGKRRELMESWSEYIRGVG